MPPKPGDNQVGAKASTKTANPKQKSNTLNKGVWKGKSGPKQVGSSIPSKIDVKVEFGKAVCTDNVQYLVSYDSNGTLIGKSILTFSGNELVQYHLGSNEYLSYVRKLDHKRDMDRIKERVLSHQSWLKAQPAEAVGLFTEGMNDFLKLDVSSEAGILQASEKFPDLKGSSWRSFRGQHKAILSSSNEDELDDG